MSNDKCVLSIQSHVTHGYVGNKAATFPLQLHGFDVDAINTVSLSNHSGYPIIRGHRMDLEEYRTILEGLKGNHFLSSYRYVLSGYINNADIIRHISSTVEEIRALRAEAGHADVIFVCDPVMGDEGKLYCQQEVIDAYRDMIHHADITTPNYFEATILSGVKVVDLASAMRAADWFHSQGNRCVVIKSFPAVNDAQLQFLVSRVEAPTTGTATAAEGSRVVRYTGHVPHHKGHYTGTGDVFAASLVAFTYAHPVEVAVGKAMAVVQDLILETLQQGGEAAASLDRRELRVTSAPESLLRPKTSVVVEKVVE